MNDLSEEFDTTPICREVPSCLREHRLWVCWRFIERSGKMTKCPMCANGRGKASSVDSATWCTFSEAIAACKERKNLAGVGFVFSANDPFTGIDLDNCIDRATGEVKAWAQPILKQLNSYSEISPSGNGIKVFVRASKPGSQCKCAYEDGAVEMYDARRFFTVTGQRLKEYSADVEQRQENVEALYQTLFGQPDSRTKHSNTAAAVPPSDEGHGHGTSTCSVDAFREMGRELCPICGHADRCKANANKDAILCFRESTESVKGFRRIKQTGECTTYKWSDETAKRREASRTNDWGRKAADFAARLPADKLKSLAERLHVTPDSLNRIGIGWNRNQSTYMFPESDANANVVGITRRWMDGRQMAMSKSKRGLILPTELDASQSLLIVEGASDTAAALSVGLQAVGRPSARGGIDHVCELVAEWDGDVIVVGERDQKPNGKWPGRDGAQSVSRQLAQRLGRPIKWALPPEGVKDVREWVTKEVPDLSATDAPSAVGQRMQATLIESADAVTPEEGESSKHDQVSSGRGPSQSSLLVELVENENVEFFRDGDTAYASVPVNEHVETWPLRTRGFKRWLARRFYVDAQKTPSSQALQDALAVLEGKALFDSCEQKVFVRVGYHRKAIYVDLADDDWRIVELTTQSWRVIPAADAPIRFRRSPGMLALPIPATGGSLDDLRSYVNVGDDESFVLICAWMIGALQSSGPYPVLAMNGEQGSGKSFTCRALRRLIDPNEAELRSEPRDERDLVIAGNNGWVIGLDNLSRVPPWLSDALCRIATGGGFATRALYTDNEEMIFSSQRPILCNGIEEVVTRPDLLDRAILVTLPAIPDSDRRDEARLWAEFELARPQLFGALLTAVSAALRERANVLLERHPRMADFARWVAAAEQGGGVPWEAGRFVDAYEGNRAEAVDTAIESSPIGPTLVDWFGERDSWSGTATELLTQLEGIAEDRVKHARGWPKDGRGVSGALRRLAPSLRVHGIEVTRGERTARARIIRIERSANRSSQPSSPSSNPADAPKKADRSVDRVTHGDDRMTVDDGGADPDRHNENRDTRSKTQNDDGRDGNDDVLPGLSGGSHLDWATKA